MIRLQKIIGGSDALIREFQTKKKFPVRKVGNWDWVFLPANVGPLPRSDGPALLSAGNLGFWDGALDLVY